MKKAGDSSTMNSVPAPWTGSASRIVSPGKIHWKDMAAKSTSNWQKTLLLMGKPLFQLVNPPFLMIPMFLIFKHPRIHSVVKSMTIPFVPRLKSPMAGSWPEVGRIPIPGAPAERRTWALRWRPLRAERNAAARSWALPRRGCPQASCNDWVWMGMDSLPQLAWLGMVY